MLVTLSQDQSGFEQVTGDLNVGTWSSPSVAVVFALTSWWVGYNLLVQADTLLSMFGPSLLRQLTPYLGYVNLIIGIAVFFIYLIVLLQAPMPTWQRVLWGVGAFTVGIFVLPVMFFVLIWQPRAKARERAQMRG